VPLSSRTSLMEGWRTLPANVAASARGASAGRDAASNSRPPTPHRKEATLQNALDDEAAPIERYVERRYQADACGELGLAVDLDDVIADESKHRDELKLMLMKWR
jgi:hypothetical protein